MVGDAGTVSEIPKRWGKGRVPFIADLPAIRSEISRAIPLTEVFASRSERLGIGYSAFCKLVARYAADARVQPVAARLAAATTPPSHPQGDPDASSTGSFAENYDPTIDPVRLRRLIGPRPKDK
jgi:hypothetical protein